MPDAQVSYQCPRCGLGTADLKDGAQPIVLKKMGNTTQLHCQICRYRWLVKEGK